jgi:hypothetical protein
MKMTMIMMDKFKMSEQDLINLTRSDNDLIDKSNEDYVLFKTVIMIVGLKGFIINY